VGRVMGISIHDFVLSEPNKTQPLLVSERIVIQISVLPLLWGKVVLDGIFFLQSPHSL